MDLISKKVLVNSNTVCRENILLPLTNDVVFQYFTILSQLNLSSEFTEQKYLNTYVPYVAQKAFDFSDKEYGFVKEHMGNGKMIEIIINSIEEGGAPLPGGNCEVR